MRPSRRAGRRFAVLCLISSTSAALAGCGGYSFNGDYAGEVERREVSGESGTLVSESWTLDTVKASASRTRGSERCDLTLERDSCSRGCYDKVILSGQRCDIDGRSLVLKEGYFESTKAEIPRGSIKVTLHWSSTEEGDAEIVDQGLLAEAD